MRNPDYDDEAPIPLVFALESIGRGWAPLIERVYAAVREHDAALPTDVLERDGSLHIWADKWPEPVRAAAEVAMAVSARTCVICARDGGPVCNEDALWGPWERTMCAYHAYAWRRDAEWDDLTHEQERLTQYAPAVLHQVLDANGGPIDPSVYREALEWLATCDELDNEHGYVWPRFVEWVLTQATRASLARCTAAHLGPFLADVTPEIREAAVLALAHLHADCMADGIGTRNRER